jgi:hypothetical protein
LRYHGETTGPVRVGTQAQGAAGAAGAFQAGAGGAGTDAAVVGLQHGVQQQAGAQEAAGAGAAQLQPHG